MSQKGFVLSWFYPPINSSESFVTYKLLADSEYQYDVWTRKNLSGGVWDRKTGEKMLESDNINVIFCEEDNVNKWVDEAYEYFVEHVDEYSFVMTRSMPPEAHELGKKIKERFPNIKWVASYGDPLVGTPYLTMHFEENPFFLRRYIEDEQPSRVRTVKLLFSPTRNAQKMVWKKKKKAIGAGIDYRVINDFTLKNADLVILNNEYQYNHVFSGEYEKYKDKGTVVYHGYREDLYPEIKDKKADKIIFSYTGHLDDIRNATPLIKAITKLAKKDPELDKKVQFNFYGHMSDKDKLLIMDNQLCDIVKLRGDVSYKDSLGILKESDWLLLFDANFAKYTDENIYFPAKLADYIGAGSNIMAVTQIRGISADIIRRVGGGVVCTHSVDEIMMYLAKIIYKGYKPKKVDEKAREEFDAKNVSKKLDKALKELIK